MQTSTIVFDHIKHEVILVPGGSRDARLEEVVEAQRAQVATSGRPGK